MKAGADLKMSVSLDTDGTEQYGFFKTHRKGDVPAGKSFYSSPARL
jgi:hypothetical protein